MKLPHCLFYVWNKLEILLAMFIMKLVIKMYACILKENCMLHLFQEVCIRNCKPGACNALQRTNNPCQKKILRAMSARFPSLGPHKLGLPI